VKEKKLLIFDFDGTLVHFPFSFFYQETHRIFIKNEWATLEQTILEECFSDFDYFRFVKSFEHLDFDHVVKKFWDEFDWLSYPNAKLFEKIDVVLEDLDQSGYGLAIATARSCTREELVVELSLLQAFEFFSAIECRYDKNQDWLDKGPQLKRVLSNLQIKPENAILIGDTPSDIRSAKSVGLYGSIGVLSGGIKRDVLELESPDFIINDVLELPKVLNDWGF